MNPTALSHFINQDITKLIHHISIYLSHSINDANQSPPTRFQAQSKPNIHIHDYLSRLINLSPIPVDGILLGLVYFKRITTHSSNTCKDPVLINSLTIHRLILSCLILATKFISDRPLPRKRLGKVAGVSELELDHLERDLLIRLDFKLCWSSDELDSLTSEVLQSSSPPKKPSSSPPSTAPTPSSPPASLQAQPSYRSSISCPIQHPTIPIQPSIRRHSTSRGIVFVKSQFIDCNLLARKYGLTSSNNPSSPTVDPTSTTTTPSPTTTTTTTAAPVTKSSSKIIVTRLEHNQIKICHTQVF